MNALLLAVALASSAVSSPVAHDRVQVLKETVIVVQAPKWACGAPVRLENDAVQTVRLCSTK